MCIFFFKQKTAYEMRISDWSSDVCSSDLPAGTSQDVMRTALAKHYGRQQQPRADFSNVQGGSSTAANFDNVRSGSGSTEAPQMRGASYRSEERRVGKECVRTGSSRGAPRH